MRISHIPSMREFMAYATQRLVALALALSITLFPHPSSWGAARPGHDADTLAGMAHVIDGDTIIVNGTRVRLEGIDAPEAGQTCKRRWVGSWACGSAATAALTRLLEGKVTSCEPRGLDKYSRTLAVCFV